MLVIWILSKIECDTVCFCLLLVLVGNGRCWCLVSYYLLVMSWHTCWSGRSGSLHLLLSERNYHVHLMIHVNAFYVNSDARHLGLWWKYSFSQYSLFRLSCVSSLSLSLSLSFIWSGTLFQLSWMSPNLSVSLLPVLN